MNRRRNSYIESTVTDRYDKRLKELLLRTVQKTNKQLFRSWDYMLIMLQNICGLMFDIR